MLNREECEKACMYLLKHCYETDAPALENGDKDKTYTFTPSGFEESEIFKRLIEEHFTPQPLEFNDLKEGMWVYDVKNKCCIYIEELTVDNPMMIIRYPMSNRESNCEWCNFEENRFYPVNIQIGKD